MRLIAFAITTTHNTVTSGWMSGDSTTVSRWPRLNGTRKKNIVMPSRAMRLAASTIPASFAGGDTSTMSSSMPTSNMTPAPSSNPRGSELANTSLNWCICEATAIAARNPQNIAAPPRLGVGRVCTWRLAPSPGGVTTPPAIARRRTTGVTSNVTAKATTRTTA